MKKVAMLVLMMVSGFCFTAFAEEMRKERKVFYGSPARPLSVNLLQMNNILFDEGTGVVFWRYDSYVGSYEIVKMEQGGTLPAGKYNVTFSYEGAMEISGDVSLDVIQANWEVSTLENMFEFFPDGQMMNKSLQEIRKIKRTIRGKDYVVALVSTFGGFEISDSFLKVSASSWDGKDVEDIIILPIDNQGLINPGYISHGEKGYSATSAWVVIVQ